jgi:hypothetical protein
VAVHEPVHLIAYAATGVISCFVFGYISSILFDLKKFRINT